MDQIFQYLVEWIGELAEQRYGRVAGCMAVLVATSLIVGGALLAWKLLT